MISPKVGTESAIVGQYKIDTPDNVSFVVVLKENEDGLREFEIILSENGKDDYSDVLKHSFYNEFVLPWTYRQKELPPVQKKNNVIQLKAVK